MKSHSKEFLELTSQAGEMGKLIQDVDWSQTKVGSFEQWPQSLKTALSICLGSKFPMVVWWGKDLTLFYNDAYIPLIGIKHPMFLGRTAPEQLSEIWHALDPLVQQVLQTGLATWSENMLLFMERKDFLEEAYFTFSYGPIRDESGAVGGILIPCQESTERILSERRLHTLHLLSSLKLTNINEISKLVMEVLSQNTKDIPFALFYYRDLEGGPYRLIASTGLNPTERAAPQCVVEGSVSKSPWFFSGLDSKTQIQVNSLRTQVFDELPQQPYEEKPDSACIISLTLPGQTTPLGAMVLGQSPRLKFDKKYQEFFELVCRHISTHVCNILVLEEEKKRAAHLAEIDRLKTDFFSNVSHEFRTPLTLMLGPLEDLLSKSGVPQSIHNELDTIHRNGLRLLKLVNTLLDFSRIEAHRMQAHYEPLDLSTTTSYLASAFDSAVHRAGMKLRIDCPKLTEKVYVDKDMWEKIVLNLLSNAFKFTLKGEIKISQYVHTNRLELKVSDTGVGIPKDELSKLFQRFHRVQGTHGRSHEGSGIGLALVKELVELHGGQISVESEVGVGTTFCVSIPLGFAHLPKDRVSHETGAWNKSSKISEAFVGELTHWLPKVNNEETKHETKIENKNRKKILLVDDNEDMRHYVSKLLSDEYDVDLAIHGAEALAYLENTTPDLVLSDVMMPVMDGKELLQNIRAHPKFKSLPVILLSARAGEAAKVGGIDMGSDDYLVKPFSALELLARIRTQLKLADMRALMIRDLETVNQELQAFSYSVSHDLRAPLRAISGFVQILNEDYGKEFSPDSLNYFHRIEQAAERMVKLIEALLDLSRYSRSPVMKQDIDMSDLVLQSISELRAIEPSREVEVIIPSDVTAFGDPHLIRVVLDNFIRNAWKYSKNSTPCRIEFGMEMNDKGTFYFIKDNGVGFDMAHASRLFRPFERLHSPSDFEGTGIGLATCQRIIHRHGGEIWVEAKPGLEAKFCFNLG